VEQISDKMVREKVTVKDFPSIAKEYQHYVWHFVQKEQNKTRLTYFSYFDKKNKSGFENPLIPFIDKLDLPYFESYAEESIDFLMDTNIHGNMLFKPTFDPIEFVYRRQFYTPIFASFYHYNRVSCTLNYCYCPEGFVQVIGDLDFKYVLDLESKLD
jgi:hypothetical protein